MVVAGSFCVHGRRRSLLEGRPSARRLGKCTSRCCPRRGSEARSGRKNGRECFGREESSRDRRCTNLGDATLRRRHRHRPFHPGALTGDGKRPSSLRWGGRPHTGRCSTTDAGRGRRQPWRADSGQVRLRQESLSPRSQELASMAA